MTNDAEAIDLAALRARLGVANDSPSLQLLPFPRDRSTWEMLRSSLRDVGLDLQVGRRAPDTHSQPLP